MLNGLLVLGGLCALEVFLVKQAVKSTSQSKMDFYEFYDLEKVETVTEPKGMIDKTAEDIKEVSFKLRVIQGGKTD